MRGNGLIQESSRTDSAPRSEASLGEFRLLPKVDLHRHITGSITFRLANQIAKRHFRLLDVPKVQQIKHLSQRERSVSSHGEYFRPWPILNTLFASLSAVREIVLAIAAQAARDGVIYIELRMGPRGHIAGIDVADEQYSFDEFLKVTGSAVREAEHVHGVIVRCVLGLARHKIVALSNFQREVLFAGILKGLANHRSAFVGVDVNGIEESAPLSLFKPFIDAAKAKHFGITVHAGEISKDTSEMRYAIEELGAQRIGHGIAAGRDPSLMKQIVDHNVLLEICPTSNKFLKLVPHISDLPIEEFIRNQVPFAVCTDNPARCRTTLSTELELVALAFQLTASKIREINCQAIEHSFAEPPLKARLLQKLKN